MRVAVIGCGKQAPKHLAGLRAAGLSSTNLVLADADVGRAQKLAEREGLSALTPDEVFQDSGIAAVVLATPTGTHAELALRAIESGKGFLCEKPLAFNAAQAGEVARRCAAAGLVGMVAYTYRSVPVFRQAYIWCREAHLLDPINTVFFRIGGRGSHQPWKHQKAEGGGAINEMLVHILDLALWLFGPPTSVHLLAKELRRPRRRIGGQVEAVDAEDLVVVRMDHPGGVAVYLEADLITPAFTQRLEVQGDTATLSVSIQPEERSYLYLAEAKGDLNAGYHPLPAASEAPYAIQARTFLDAVYAQCPPAYGTLKEAVLLQEIIEDLQAQ